MKNNDVYPPTSKMAADSSQNRLRWGSQKIEKSNGSEDLQFVMNLFEATREDYLADARLAAEILVKERGAITVNDIREICPPPDNIDPRVMGAIFNRKLWQKVGYIHSSRAHMRPIAMFERKTS